MAVIVIIGILSCITSVSGGFYDHSCYETTIERIVMDMRRFRMKAICNNLTYKFRIYRDDDIYISDADSKSDYIFYYLNNQDEEVRVYHGEFSSNYTLYKNLNEKLVTANSYDRISFTGYGTACTGTIGLKDVNGKFTQIVISQLGRIRVER